MINVYYWPREQRLVMHGHAEHRGNYSPVVCGAASALFNALCTTTNGFMKYKLLKGRYHLNSKGLAYCKIWPKRRYFKRTRVAIGMCVGGLMMLEDKHPHLVHVEVATGVPFDDTAVIQEDQEGGVTTLKKFCYDMNKNRPLDSAKAETNGQKGTKNGKAGNAT